MRVLHVIGTLEPQAGHQLRSLVRRLPYHSEIVSLSHGGVVPDGVPVHRVVGGGEHDPAVVRHLRQLIRAGRYDLVHTHLYRANVQGRIAARLAGVPHVIATEHRLGPGVHALYLAAERLGEVTVAGSEAIAARLRSSGVPQRRIVIIPKAIDAREFRFDPELRATTRSWLGVEPGVPLIGGVGRLDPDKRFDLLIRAITEVPGAVLALTGDGPARADLERLAVIEGVADRVLFTGALAEPLAMYCAMDVFASPGHGSFGLAGLEAAAAGLPVVYGSCVPFEERAAARDPVPGTHRLSQDRESLPRSLRTELLCLAERGGARLPARSAGVRYDAAHLAASVGSLYERISARPGRRIIGPLLAYRGRFGRKNSFPLPGGSVRNA
ncbi:glycosyltransferase [Actinoplanes sp. G11-F43]|uniref:glycosyltransferase n=1 Tax=Actinoplanes sp. G11-F43 TaxID=3424130 RepID=UPI003D32BC01